MPVVITEYGAERIAAINLTLSQGQAVKNAAGAWAATVTGSTPVSGTFATRGLATEFIVSQLANYS